MLPEVLRIRLPNVKELENKNNKQRSMAKNGKNTK